MEDSSSQAVIEAAQRFASGVVQGQSLTFAPSTAEFRHEVDRREEFIKLAARPRLPAPQYRRGPLAPFEINRQRALAQNAHLPVLFEDVSYDRWRQLSKNREIPVGAKWVACLAIVYGPPAKPKSVAAE